MKKDTLGCLFFIGISDERQLLCPAELFDGRLPPQCRALVRDCLLIHQAHRQAAAGIFGAPSALVGAQPFSTSLVLPVYKVLSAQSRIYTT